MNNNLKNIILIGMSGSGKTTVGEFVSKKLNMKFMDTDDIIVFNRDMTIECIFNKYGEKYFRNLEKKVIKEISLKNNIVISTGGGVVLNKANMDALREKGIVFFLKARMDTLVKNIENSFQTHRPLLKNNNKLDYTIKEIYKEREKLYFNNADYIIKIDNKSVEEIGHEIIHIFNKINSCSYF